MGKKMKIPFLTPYCHQPRTSSFRTTDKTLLKTLNSAYSGATINCNEAVTDKPESLVANSSESASFPTESDGSGGDFIETVIRGARSERLFFEPGETSSILKEAESAVGGGLPFKESLALSMESHDPYVDFKKSMEEMVKAYGLKNWEDLEGLLFSYLKVNGRSNHGYIIGAFVDLLVGITFASSSPPSSSSCSSSSNSCSCSRSPSSPLSFYTSSSSSSDDCSSTNHCVASLEEEEEEEEEAEEEVIIDMSPC